MLRLSNLPLSTLSGMWSWTVSSSLCYQVSDWAFEHECDRLANTAVLSSLLEDLLQSGEQPYVLLGDCPDLRHRAVLLNTLANNGIAHSVQGRSEGWLLTPKGRIAIVIGSPLSDSCKVFAARGAQLEDMTLFELLFDMDKRG